MIKPFLDDNFLLQSRTAEILYHEYAADLPIIDYHNHLSPKDIAEDRVFQNITQVWLAGDHYKWRAMRTLGIDERYITGDASDKHKFNKWAQVVPYTIRNPLYHWTHLELKRYFNVQSLLTPQSASRIYATTSAMLQSSGYSARNLLRKMNVEVVCTTDDPSDDLSWHKKMSGDDNPRMLMTFRPDAAILIDRPSYPDYIVQLGKAANIQIDSFQDLQDALSSRLDYFHQHGCRLADHGLSHLTTSSFTEVEVNNILSKRVKGHDLSEEEVEKYQSAILYFLGCAYAEKNWVQQFHLGALRNTNHRLLQKLGPDTGFDSIGTYQQAQSLANFLNLLDKEGKLTKTILYNLNPGDNEMMATMIGNFNDGSIRGKMQFGSAWWFLDQKDGMEKQLNALSNMGLLSCFIGMLTDSRSFLSFPRHEYFRRILCNLIGRDVENGELPDDLDWLGKIVSDICYHNAKQYFSF